MIRVLVSAADASGDAHAAELVQALRARRPDARFFGVGGVALQQAGLELVADQREIAVGGLVEVLGALGGVVRVWRRLGRAVARTPPDLAILVDSPDFHLPLALRLRRRRIPVLYYVGPQVWAWRRGRVRALARRVDRLAVIFPFEPAVYAGSGLRVDFVGHPLVERLQRFAEKHDRASTRLALGLDPDAPVVVLLPGSRRNELRRVLPLMLKTARHLLALEPRARFVLALAPTIARETAEPWLREARRHPAVPIEVVEGRTYEAVVAADVALAKPGTITVEVALLGCPLVVAGRANPVSAALLRRIVHLPSFTMPNLIAGAAVVPEFLQESARPDRIAEAIRELLHGTARELQLARLESVRARLGAGGAAERTADVAEELLRERGVSA